MRMRSWGFIRSGHHRGGREPPDGDELAGSVTGADEYVDPCGVAIGVEDVVVGGVGGHGVTSLTGKHGDNVVVVGIHDAQLRGRSADAEVEIVIARVEPDLVGTTNVLHDSVELAMSDLDRGGARSAGCGDNPLAQVQATRYHGGLDD
jgi:hypothetical protein